MSETTSNVESIAAGFAKLREPFPPDAIEHRPQVTCKACRDSREKCCNQNGHKKLKCSKCNNYMTTAHVDLSYVGHAAVTNRLLQVDPAWTWKPLAFDKEGLPLFARDGLWIELTVLGVTRIGFGDAAGKDPSPFATKEMIGDAIRNAAMRFGVALELWSKSDLKVNEELTKQQIEGAAPVEKPVELATADQVRTIKALLEQHRLPEGTVDKWFANAGVDVWEDMPRATIANCIKFIRDLAPKPPANVNTATGEVEKGMGETLDDEQFKRDLAEAYAEGGWPIKKSDEYTAFVLGKRGLKTLEELDQKQRDDLIAFVKKGPPKKAQPQKAA